MPIISAASAVAAVISGLCRGNGMECIMYCAVVSLPDSMIDRLGKAEKASDEGIKIAVEQIQQLKELEGIAGVHLMAIEWEHRVAEIVEKAGLLPRPSLED